MQLTTALLVVAAIAPVFGHIAAGTTGMVNVTVTASVTRTVTAYETFCPDPTTFTEGTKTYTATAEEWITVKECPHKCTITYDPAYPTVLPVGEVPKYGNKTVIPIVTVCPCPEDEEECPCVEEPEPIIPCPEEEDEDLECICEDVPDIPEEPVVLACTCPKEESEDLECICEDVPDVPEEPVVSACTCPEEENEDEECICEDKPVVSACPCPKDEENCSCDNVLILSPAVVGDNSGSSSPASPKANGPEVVSANSASTFIPGAMLSFAGFAALLL
ncbi:hypothetical protein WAI453_005804 [Rhynchosporium graminicola]